MAGNRMAKDRIYLSPPSMSGREREMLLDAFDSNWIAPLGPHVDGLESEFASVCEAASAAALSSGTAALHLSLVLLGVEPEDEVWTSTLTFAATANAIRYVGAKPVFIDSDFRTWNLNPNLLDGALRDAAARNRLPKAVIVVDLYGQCAEYDAIVDSCEQYGIPVVEDAAESLGATYRGRPAGSFGKLACFSFNGNKIITASGGGMLVSDDAALCERARWLASQARDPAPHYQHSVTGYNYRMSNLLAAVARGQLESLEQRVTKRRENFKRYSNALSHLPGIAFMPEPDNYRSNRWLSCISVDADRFGKTPSFIIDRLAAENIESRPVWKPMHMQPAFADCRSIGGQVAETLFRTGLCLPSGHELTEADIARVTDVIQASAATRYAA